MIEKRIIGIVGMPGSGKSVTNTVAKELGFSTVIMGDVVREETVKRGFELTANNIGKIMLKIRVEEGSTIVAKKCIPKIWDSSSKTVLVEGIRSLDEVEEFKKNFIDFTLVAIYSSPDTRFKRLYKRQRSDDPSNWKVFKKRDTREIGVGIGATIALADYTIVNEGTLKQFKNKIKRLIQEI